MSVETERECVCVSVCLSVCLCVDPCDGVECSVGQVCQVDSASRRAVCRCGGTGPSGQCPMLYVPVCASDGLTYSNECVMRVSACQRRCKDIRVLFRDECSAGTSTCQFFFSLATSEPAAKQ